MSALESLFLPELGTPRKGSVRDLYEIGDELMLVASDRISCYDSPLKEQIPHKGRILTEIAAYWFEKTKDILRNHVVSYPDPNVLIAKRCKPLQVEVVVRGYLAGSLATAYEKGVREAYGLTLPEGMRRDEAFPVPIITPTTKSHTGHDEPTTPAKLVENGVVTQEQWNQIASVAPKLFARGQQVAKERGLTLVDTKYEFGIDSEGDLILIDEIHTPDSSRYWFPDGAQLRVPDKQFVRDWLKEQGFTGEGEPPALPSEIIEEASSRYQALYEQLLGRPFVANRVPVMRRIVNSLKKEGRIVGSCVLIAVDSESDRLHADKIAAKLSELGVPVQIVSCSAEESTQELLQLTEYYNHSSEPLVAITVTGPGSPLEEVMGANMRWPVISSLSYSEESDATVMTVIDPESAAICAAKILEMAR